MWDLNRLNLVRVLTSGIPVEVRWQRLKKAIVADATSALEYTMSQAW